MVTGRSYCVACHEPAVQRVLKPGRRVSFRCKAHRLSKIAATRAHVILFDIDKERTRGGAA